MSAQPRKPAGSPVGGEFSNKQGSAPTSGLPVVARPAFRPDLIPITPPLAAVLDRLNTAGGEAILVGGCVRDALLGVESNDVDIECYGLSFAEVTAALRTDTGDGQFADGMFVDEVGVAFGVVKCRTGGEDFDIALPRRDSKTGEGHTGFDVQVDHNLTFAEASARRDFTINAIGWNPTTGEVLDPHNGQADLETRVLRHVSDAFADDPLRVLRGVQFAGRFEMTMAEETVAVCASLHDTFRELSIERVWGEWSKIGSKAVKPSMSLRVLEQTGWISHHPELVAVYGVPQDPTWHPEGPVEVHTAESADAAAAWCDQAGVTDADRALTVLAATVHDLGKATHTQISSDGRITSHGHAPAGVEPATAFLRSVGAPADLIVKAARITAEHMCVACKPDQVTPAAVRRLARRLQPATIEEWARVVEADHLGRGSASHSGTTDIWLDLARQAGVQSEVPKPFVKGEMLMAHGLKPGPQFAEIIDLSREAQDNGEIVDAATAQMWVAELIGRRAQP